MSTFNPDYLKPNCFVISNWVADSKIVHRLLNDYPQRFSLVRDSLGINCLFVDSGVDVWHFLCGRLLAYPESPTIRVFYDLMGFDFCNEDSDFFNYYYHFSIGGDYED